MRQVDIVILNGTSSAGKTTIARAMQALWCEPVLRLGIDHFLHNLPPCVLQEPGWCNMALDGDGHMVSITLGPRGRNFFRASYQAIAQFVDAGVPVIVDDVLFDREVVAFVAALFEQFNPLLVGVRCRLEVAIERERRRGDRLLGGASVFHEIAHRYLEYDVEIDSSDIDASEAATIILNARGQPRAALSRVHARFAHEERIDRARDDIGQRG